MIFMNLLIDKQGKDYTDWVKRGEKKRKNKTGQDVATAWVEGKRV